MKVEQWMKRRVVVAAVCALVALAVGFGDLAQGAQDDTPAEESVCDAESGAAFGLCNAYCEAMDCESAAPSASENACNRVKDKWIQITGRASLPCESCVPGAPAECQPNYQYVDEQCTVESLGAMPSDKLPWGPEEYCPAWCNESCPSDPFCDFNCAGF